MLKLSKVAPVDGMFVTNRYGHLCKIAYWTKCIVGSTWAGLLTGANTFLLNN